MQDEFLKQIDVIFEKMIKNEEKKKISAVTYQILLLSLYSLSSGYFSALYIAGKRYGKDELAKKIEGDLNKSLPLFCKIFSKMGLGKLKLIGKTDGKRMTFQLKNGLAKDIGVVEKHICYFEAGIIAGFLEGKLNKHVIVQETLCCGMGDEYCEFIARIK